MNVLLMFDYHLFCFLSTLMNYLFYLSVYCSLYILSIGFQILHLRESDVSDLLLHSELGDYLVGYTISFLEIVICPGCDLFEKMKLRASASQNKTYSID